MPARPTEVDAYIYIKKELELRGWDARNPLRSPGGQVYTQNEVLSHPELGKLLGKKKPENVVSVTDSIFWVIESKRKHSELRKAVREAEDYAGLINKSSNVQALFVSGVAGNNEDSFLIESRFWNGEQFVPITANGKQLTSLLSPEIVREVLAHGPDLVDVPIDTERFLAAAESINEILHAGAINKNARARVMAALLLAMVEGTPNVDDPPSVLIENINARAKRLLKQESKEEFFQYIQLLPPPTEDNHVKYKRALVQTIQELNNLNIRSAMQSGADVLGKFYEVFLKYGNGAKEIGIVLTPRHITRFAVEVLGVSDRDTVYDPTCGTGGFLVAAFDHVRRNYSADAVERFRLNNLFGVEQEPEVAALAIVNMIFRGDGKTNIREGNCFTKRIIRQNGAGEGKVVFVDIREEGTPGITRVLMNPPFKAKKGDDPEYKFVNHALAQMEDGGLLFAVLPYSQMVKPNKYKQWRKQLLENHTLVSVLTLPPDLFYPVGVHTIGIIVRKGYAHPPEQNVLWVRAINDGHLKSKGKRLESWKVLNDYSRTNAAIVRAFVADPNLPVANTPGFRKAAPIDFTDSHLELVPENYLDQLPPTPEELQAGLEQAMREAVAFLIKTGKSLNE